MKNLVIYFENGGTRECRSWPEYRDVLFAYALTGRRNELVQEKRKTYARGPVKDWKSRIDGEIAAAMIFQ
ncbi:MAG TPA: hypothetical protein VI968_03475 [archaeon]|nr:hypothetical protein [archaeon]